MHSNVLAWPNRDHCADIRSFKNLKFKNFLSKKTYCGKSQSLFDSNFYVADIVPVVNIIDSVFENVHVDAFASLMSPPIEWANTDDCGNFPCTAP